jgi:hypothetical protein
MTGQTSLPWDGMQPPLHELAPGPRGAIISECGRYRPLLWRCWGAGPWWCVVGQNPSVADGQVDDPTLRRVVGLCREGGAGGVLLCVRANWRRRRGGGSPRGWSDVIFIFWPMSLAPIGGPG